LTWAEFRRRLFSRFNRHAEIRAGWYLVLPLAYCICLGAFYVFYGRLLQFLPLVFFFIAIPIVALLGPAKGVLKYWTPLILILLSYEALAGTIGSIAASDGVTSLYGIDSTIWRFNLTGWVQSTFSSAPLTTLTTLFYAIHMPLVAATAATVWFLRKEHFGKYVTAMALTSYSALATFIIIPTSPPWYVGAAANLLQGAGASPVSTSFASLSNLVESDAFAAFPSLHGAYAMIFCYFMLKLDRRLAFVAIPVTVGILFSTLYLGQHYLIDLLGGALYALVPCAISEHFQIFNVKQ
jgi:membrane-associated phospholipid phosphatase